MSATNATSPSAPIWTRVLPSCCAKTCGAFSPSIQPESDGDGRDDFDLVAVQRRRFIDPLPDGIDRGLRQQGMTGLHREFADSAVDPDHSYQFHYAGNARHHSQTRIQRFDTMQQLAEVYIAALFVSSDARRYRRNGRRRIDLLDRPRRNDGSGCA